MIRNWLNRFGPSSYITRQTRARRRRRLCTLEGLEDRVLLSSSPTPFLVTDTSDSPADTGSLRYAINLANANSNTAGSLITFAPNVFNTTTPQVITLLNGALDLKETAGPEVIDGPGPGALTIWGNDTYQGFDVAGGVTASLTGLTIERGHTAALNGGGIDDDGTLMVTNCTIADNVSGGMGGGIYDGGALTVTGSTIQGNVSKGGVGGGLDVDAGATANITDSTIQGNSATGTGSVGGGIAVTVDSVLTVANSTVGGASSSEINTSSLYGGGIFNGGGCTLTITASTIEGNSVSALGSDGGGIENDTNGTLTLADSTIVGNSAAGLGGGIQTEGTLAVVTNSTFVDNSAEFGGGIETEKMLTVFDSTIAYNGVSMGGAGGGLFVDTGAMANVDNTIVAQNFDIHVLVTATPTADDIGNSGTLSGSNNLIGTGGAGGLTNGSTVTRSASPTRGWRPLWRTMAGRPKPSPFCLAARPSTRGVTRWSPPASRPISAALDSCVSSMARSISARLSCNPPPSSPSPSTGAWIALTLITRRRRTPPASRGPQHRLALAGHRPASNHPQPARYIDRRPMSRSTESRSRTMDRSSFPAPERTTRSPWPGRSRRPTGSRSPLLLRTSSPTLVASTSCRATSMTTASVNNKDVKGVSNEFHRTGGAQPTIFGDIVGDGTVDARDLKAVREHVGTSLPRLRRTRQGSR